MEKHRDRDVKINIDGQDMLLPAQTNLLQACEQAGAEIPRFCYHERLSVAGNCRMCLVEVKGAPKPVASCATPIMDGMTVSTKSQMVEDARKGVMEFLLVNHPLDCPICDQAGECDLQDQSLGYGIEASRFQDNKRAVEDKYMGPLIKTIMTRCIHCTRCVRFASEVAGVPEIGSIGRGEDMEIVSYLDKTLTSELSGNVIDLCPVGALTSKPYAFTARSWELSKTQTIDVMDGMGSNICLDARGGQVMRIVPRINDEINEEWISDKARFIWDGLASQRLDRPYIRKEKGGRLVASSWEDSLQLIASKMKHLQGNKIAGLAGDLACGESMFALKELLGSLGSSLIDCRQDGCVIGDREAERENTKEANTKEANTKEANTKEANTKEANTKEANTKEASIKEASIKEASIKEASIKEENINGESIEERGIKGEDIKGENIRQQDIKEASIKSKDNIREQGIDWQWRFNSTIAGIEEADALLLIGCNPRYESAVLNSRIRKRWLAGDFPIGLIGSKVDLTYDYNHLGENPNVLNELKNGANGFADRLRQARKPMVILGAGALVRPDSKAIYKATLQLVKEIGGFGAQWNGFNVLFHQASRLAALAMGFTCSKGFYGILERSTRR